MGGLLTKLFRNTFGICLEEQRAEMKPFDKAIKNALIIREICKYLDQSDLLTARTVCRQWRDVFTEIVQKICCIEFYCNSREKWVFKARSRNHRNPSSSGKNLSKFNDFLKQTGPVNFPCTSFVIMLLRLRVTKSDTDIDRFLHLHGEQIQTLEFMTFYLSPEVEIFAELDRISAIKSMIPINFRLRKFSDVFNKTKPTKPNIYLTALKKFTWEYCPENILREILTNAPNLDEVEFRNESDLKIVVKSGKASAIKTLIVNGDKAKSSDVFELANFSPKLEILTIRWNPSEQNQTKIRVLTQSLFTLIQSNSNTLTHLSLDNCTGSVYTDWNSLNFLMLQKLKTLFLGNNYSQPVLPSGINLSKIFSNLHTLNLSSIGQDFDTSFRHTGNLATVKVVEISVKMNHIWMQQLKTRLCPNFDSLVIYVGFCSDNLPTMLKYVFEYWQHLVNIEFKQLRYSSCDLDSTFLGIEQTIVDELNRKLKNGAEIETIKHLSGIEPCILSMKKLKRLKFDLYRHEPYQGPIPFPAKPMLLSRLSWLLGFALMPEIEVSVYIDPVDIRLVPGFGKFVTIQPFAKFNNVKTGKPIETEAKKISDAVVLAAVGFSNSTALRRKTSSKSRYTSPCRRKM